MMSFTGVDDHNFLTVTLQDENKSYDCLVTNEQYLKINNGDYELANKIMQREIERKNRIMAFKVFKETANISNMTHEKAIGNKKPGKKLFNNPIVNNNSDIKDYTIEQQTEQETYFSGTHYQNVSHDSSYSLHPKTVPSIVVSVVTNDSENNSNNHRPVTPTKIWTDTNIRVLIEQYKQREIEFESSIKKVVWRKLAHELSSQSGINITWSQCDTKFKGLKQYYKTVKTHNDKSGNSYKYRVYYDLLDEILELRTATNSESDADTEKLSKVAGGSAFETLRSKKRKREDTTTERRHREKLMRQDKYLGLFERLVVRFEQGNDTNNSVAPINQLLIFLRFLATGTHLSCIGDFGGVHLSTVSRINVRVGIALARLYNRFIKMPQTPNEINECHLKFYEKARFPRVIGVIDCTHIKIQSPGGADAEIFRNRKGYFSINVQVIGNADLKLMNVVARWPGSSHDATIFNNSRIKEDFQNNRFPNSVLLGDAGYNMRPYLLTPLQTPLIREEQLYNESHIRTRNTIERNIGVWKRRFPVLAYGCRLKLDTTLTIIIASAVVYNICKEANEEEPPDPEDMERFLQVMQEDQVPHIPPVILAQPNANNGHLIRRELIQNYFRHIEE